jgi:hypothetical protein
VTGSSRRGTPGEAIAARHVSSTWVVGEAQWVDHPTTRVARRLAQLHDALIERDVELVTHDGRGDRKGAATGQLPPRAGTPSAVRAAIVPWPQLASSRSRVKKRTLTISESSDATKAVSDVPASRGDPPVARSRRRGSYATS